MTFDRRGFLRALALAGAAGASALFLPRVIGGTSPFGLPPKPLPPDKILEEIPQVIRSPLRVAQWYDYWPGSILYDFTNYMRDTYGVSVEIEQSTYATNDELLLWLSQKRDFDVVFPTQDTLEWLRLNGLVRPLRFDWLPNVANLFPEYERPPWAVDKVGNLYATAYLAGTTGLGFRTDKGWTTADVEGLGWDFLWLPSLAGVDLNQKLSVMLDICRESLGVGLKKTGFDATGTPLVSEGQWSLNTREAAQVAAARDAMKIARPRWFDTNSYALAPFLVNGVLYGTQIWSQDAMYALRPHTTTPQPVDFVNPRQGFARWVDSACIPTLSSNVYTAHLFLDYLIRGDVAAKIADWNVGTTPNAAAYDLLTTHPNGWDPRQDARLYPDATTLARGEYHRALPLTIQLLYYTTCADVRYG